VRRQWNGFNIELTELPDELISSSLTEPAKHMPASPSVATEEGVEGCPARTLLCGIALAIVLVTIALHFGLVDIGQWAYDEYSLISSYRDNGWISFSTRLLHWSPRPVSEILIGIYACLVNWTHRPLIGAFLGFLWLTLISAPLIAFVQVPNKLRANSRRSVMFLTLFGFGLLALFLVEHNLGSLFYSPVISAAYLTTLSAITLCFFQLAFSLTERQRGRVTTALALLAAAASSETGAFFAIVFGSLSLIFMSAEILCGLCQKLEKILWFLVPVFVGTGMFYLIISNRLQTQQALFATAEYHNVVISLKTAVGQLTKECLASGQRLSDRGILFGLLLKGSFFFAARYCWLSSEMKVARKQILIVLALSLIGTTYFSVAATYYGYGGLTNGWHQELRQCLIMLFVATVALLSCHYHARNISARRCEWIGSIAFCITLSLVIPARARGLIHDYKNYSVCIESRTKSWKSGLSNSNTMIWWSPPRGQVADTFLFAPGVYNSESKAPGVVDIMHFFHKDHLEIRPWTEVAETDN
jgi:hypothetical protein